MFGWRAADHVPVIVLGVAALAYTLYHFWLATEFIERRLDVGDDDERQARSVLLQRYFGGILFAGAAVGGGAGRRLQPHRSGHRAAAHVVAGGRAAGRCRTRSGARHLVLGPPPVAVGVLPTCPDTPLVRCVAARQRAVVGVLPGGLRAVVPGAVALPTGGQLRDLARTHGDDGALCARAPAACEPWRNVGVLP